MELVDRYLQAVKFWLPRKQKDDIIAELAEDLRSQIEEKETELGRQLDVGETESILKRCGTPLAVAARYLPQRSLIGPGLFPIYSLVIRSLILYFLLPWFLLWMGVTIFSPDFRADHPGVGIFLSLGPWWLACTYSLFFCTLSFALLERSGARSRLLNTWNPRSLPAAQGPNQIDRGRTIVAITMCVAVFALYFDIGAFRREFHSFGLDLTLTTYWPYFFWALVVLSLGGIALAFLNLSNQRWTRFSASLRLGIDCYSWTLVYLLFRSNPLQSISGSDVPPDQAARIVNTINFVAAISAIAAIIAGLVVLAFDIRRILRVAPPS